MFILKSILSFIQLLSSVYQYLYVKLSLRNKLEEVWSTAKKNYIKKKTSRKWFGPHPPPLQTPDLSRENLVQTVLIAAGSASSFGTKQTSS